MYLNMLIQERNRFRINCVYECIDYGRRLDEETNEGPTDIRDPHIPITTTINLACEKVWTKIFFCAKHAI